MVLFLRSEAWAFIRWRLVPLTFLALLASGATAKIGAESGRCMHEQPPPAEWTVDFAKTQRLGGNMMVLSAKEQTRWAVYVGRCVFGDWGGYPASHRWKTLETSNPNGQTITSFAASTEAALVINGGYFGWGRQGLHPVSLLVRSGEERAWSIQERDGTYFQRAAVGFVPEGRGESSRVDFVWSQHVPDGPVTVIRRPLPVRTSPEFPPSVEPEAWLAREAMGGGPMLLYRGQRVVAASIVNESFNGRIDEMRSRARTGMGVDAFGNLWILVLEEAGGTTLAGLTELFEGLGAVSALNLDGGGSSSLVIRDEKIAPAVRAERAIYSAWALTPVH